MSSALELTIRMATEEMCDRADAGATLLAS
jgi:hypothetical protein